jgi:hypothetical protein
LPSKLCGSVLKKISRKSAEFPKAGNSALPYSAVLSLKGKRCALCGAP